MDIRRRKLLAAGAIAALLGTLRHEAAGAPRVTVYKTPYCGCCGGWVEHMRANGFDVAVREVNDLTPYRERLGVPESVASCHTAQIEGYAVEGHVPAADVRRLLRERPKAAGLAVPSMVPGSPGMTGKPVPYDTLLFTRDGSYAVYARH
jgi:hypothetical protein